MKVVSLYVKTGDGLEVVGGWGEEWEINVVMRERLGWAGLSCMPTPQESQTLVAMEFPTIPITHSHSWASLEFK